MAVYTVTLDLWDIFIPLCYLIPFVAFRIKEIRQQIEHYEKRNLELVSKWPNGMTEWIGNEKYNLDTKIRELKWTIYDDW